MPAHDRDLIQESNSTAVHHVRRLQTGLSVCTGIMVADHQDSDLLQGPAPMAYPRGSSPTRCPDAGMVPGAHSRPPALGDSSENHRLELIGKNTEDGVNSMWLQVNLTQHGLALNVNKGNPRGQVELLQSVLKPADVIPELRRSQAGESQPELVLANGENAPHPTKRNIFMIDLVHVVSLFKHHRLFIYHVNISIHGGKVQFAVPPD